MANEIKKIPKRSEVRKEDTWATEDIFVSDEAWEAALETAKSCLPEMEAYKGTLGQSGEQLYNYLHASDVHGKDLHALYGYASLKGDEDTSVSKYQEMRAKITSFFVAVSSATSFDTPEIMAIPDETLEQFYKDKPELELYRRHLTKIRRRKAHTLSDAEEMILAAAGEMSEAPESIASAFGYADLKFPDVLDKDGNPHQLTSGSYIPLVQSEDRELRKNAFEGLYNTYAKYRNTSAAMFDAQVRQLKFFSKTRKYSSNLEASLDRTEVPTEVYHNLIRTVNENLPFLHKYMRLRKKMMGVDELHMYDVYTTLVADAETEIPFEQAKKNVLEGLQPLGQRYIDMLKEGFENRWIDVYENEGKRSGAYSSGGARPHPFVLLNHKNTLDAQFTLAHEMGHALHSYLSIKNQPDVYSHYVIFVAEVASTCNEVLLMRHLLSKTTDPKERAYLINYFMEQFRTTLYRQTMFAEFELAMNRCVEEGGSLTADRLDEMYGELNKRYYGNDIVCDPEISREWARIPHFFYNFYVFQYATGFSAAVAIANRILTEGQPAVDDYLKFLSSGCSQDPISLLRIAGVDMATEKPIQDALNLFNELIDEMETLI